MANKQINIEVNGRLVSVQAGSTVLQACEAIGIEIPRFCYHERLLVAGNCRMCLVEVVGSPKPQASCALPVSRGPGGAVMKIVTDSPLVKKAREGVLEMLLVNHPLDCPICDQGGECDLQDQSMAFGSDRSRFFEGKRGVEDKDLGPLVKTVMTRCIHCTRCIRFASEIAGVADLGTSARGRETEVGTYVEKVMETERSGNLVDLCPVGALTSKPYAFKARPWERDSTEMTDMFDGFGASIKVQTRGDEVLRILPVQDDERNGEQLGDKSRFSVDGLNVQRVSSGYLVKERSGKLSPVKIEDVLKRSEEMLKKVKSVKIRVSSEVGLDFIEEAISLGAGLRKAGKDVVVEGRGIAKSSSEEVGRTTHFENSLKDLSEADVVLLAGVDPRKESPLLNVKLREGFLRGTMDIYSLGNNRNRTFPVSTIGTTPKELNQLINGNHRLSKKLAEAKRPVLLIGASLYRREDEAHVRSVREQLSSLVQISENVQKGQKVKNVLHHRPNSSGAMLSQLPGFQGFKKQKDISQSLVILVGVSKGELKELGQSLFTEKCQYLLGLASHGDGRREQCDAILPLPRFTEYDGVFVDMTGQRNSSNKVVSTPFGENYSDYGYNQRSRRSSEFVKYDEISSRTESKDSVEVRSGRMTVVNRPMIPAVHDYYLEGHNASRRSETMAKCSQTFTTKNFIN